MKLLQFDRKHGKARLLTHTMDDLWHLYNLVMPGDLVHAMTYRREERQSDKLRPERGEKKRMRLGLRVQHVEFHEFGERLRIAGVIEEGPQDLGAHHTLNLEPGDVIEITKSWREVEIQRIREAEEQTAQPVLCFIALDDEEAVLALMRQYGVQEVARIQSQRSGKDYPHQKDMRDAYMEEVLEKLRQIERGEEAIIVLGPGFAKEEFHTYVRAHEPEMGERLHVLSTGQSGMQGVHEVLRSGLGAEILAESRVAQETSMVERLMEEISRDGLAAYGPEAVRQALGAGAVETLLATDKVLRSSSADEMLRLAEETRAKVIFVSTVHEAGKRLEALGGWGALLRYRRHHS
ncbi:MAG: mRNA surveillance protein pelota [Candidatus Thermoplasmatota archaeon]